MATDYFHYGSNAGIGPVVDGFAVTPADTDVSIIPRALYVGTGGDVVVKTSGGSTLTFVGVPNGAFLPVRCLQVKAATTASDILALY
jgi:hypothetical protein